VRKTGVVVGLVFVSLVSLLGLTTGCGGSSGNNNTQPPPPGPTIAVSPTSASVLVGQTQTFSLTVTGNPTVTCSVNGPGSCSVSGTTSVSYTGAAPGSGGDWKATLTLTAANAGGQATASVAIALGQIIGVTIAPTSVALTTAQPQKFTATVQGNGTFDNTVSWSASAGAIDSSGNYTPPPEAQGPLTVTVTATSEDATQSASAAVVVIFNWVAYYAPQALNDSGATAIALSSDGTELVVADNRAIPDSPDTAAGLLLFDAKTGELEDSSWTISPTPSKLYSMVTDPATGIIYAAGYQGKGSSCEALLLKITPGDPLQVTTLTNFQLGNVRTEVHVLQLYGGSIYLAVNTDYQVCPSFCTSGDFVVLVNPSSGNITSELPLRTMSESSDITGMYVSPQWIYATGNILDTSGDITGTYEAHYVPATGEVQPPVVIGESPLLYDSSVFQNAVGELLIAGTVYYSAAQQSFEISGSDASFNGNLFGLWDGGNDGTVSVNRVFGAALNPQGGLTVVGSCSQVGNSDPSQTDGCAISWLGIQPANQYLPIIWSQRFDSAHMPGGTSAVWWGAVYDSQGNLLTAGRGTDGRSGCGATPCSTAVVGKFVPPPAGP